MLGSSLVFLFFFVFHTIPHLTDLAQSLLLTQVRIFLSNLDPFLGFEEHERIASASWGIRMSHTASHAWYTTLK